MAARPGRTRTGRPKPARRRRAREAAIPAASGAIAPSELAVSIAGPIAEPLPLRAIAIADRRVIAVGDATLASTDGAHFYRRAHPGAAHALAVEGGSVVACGDGFLAVTIDTGATWRHHGLPHRLVEDAVATAIGRDRDGAWWLAFRDLTIAWSRRLDGRWNRAPFSDDNRVSSIVDLDGVLGFGNVACGVWDGQRYRKPMFAGHDLRPCRIVVRPDRDRSWLALGREAVGVSYDRGRTFGLTPLDEARIYDVADVAWIAGALVVAASGGYLYRWTGSGFVPLSSRFRRVTAIASWGDGAFACTGDGLILRIASPRDPTWDGAIDEWAPRTPSVAPVPTPLPIDRDEVYRDLFHEALLVHDDLSASLRGDHRRTDLERMIDDAADDDLEPYRVYADWLHANGDARAELAAVQLARADDSLSETLRAAERDLLDEVIGELARAIAHSLVHVDWRAGFPHRARTRFAADTDRAAAIAAIAAVLDDANGRFLRRLAIERAPGNDLSPIVAAIARAYRPALRILRAGTDDELAATRIDLSPVYPAVPALRELAIAAGHVVLGDVVLPHLVSFDLVTTGLVERGARAIAAARWPSLERLSLQVGARRRGGTAKLRDLRPILDGAGLPRLAHLAITHTEFTDDLIAALAASALLPQLATLDVSTGTLTDIGARSIYRHQSAFAHLQSIDLGNNLLPPATRDLLAPTGLRISFGTQRADDGNRELP
jgi:hypothetical protein